MVEKIIHIPETFSFDLSIIIPAYNEEHRIKSTLLLMDDYVQTEKLNAEIIVVNDGSADRTEEIVRTLQAKIQNLSLLRYEKNRGKGYAVKHGIHASKGRYILFADADNSTPIEEFEKLFQKMKERRAHIAIGSRYLHDSRIQIKQPIFRVMLGRIANFLISLFLLDGIKDTQCGFKLFEHKAAKEVFSFQKITRFGFDIEILVVANSLGYTTIEVPVSWFNSSESRVRPIKDALVTLRDLAYIKLNLWSGRYADDQRGGPAE